MMVRKLDDQSRKGESFVDVGGSNGAKNANEYSFMILFLILPAFFSDLVRYIFWKLDDQSQKWESFVDGSDGNSANNDDDKWDKNDDGHVLGGDGDDHVEGDEGGGEEIGRSISEGEGRFDGLETSTIARP